MFKELIQKIPQVSLDQKDEALIQKCIAQISQKKPGANRKLLHDLFSNELKYAKVAFESNAGFTSGDVDIFNDIALITVGKIFTSSVLDKIASVQSLKAPYGYVYYVEFEYGDDYAAEGVSAGDKLRSKRTKEYGRVPEQTAPRRIKTEVRRELLETHIRKYDISWTFESMLGLKSVYGDEADTFIDDKVVNTVANKAKDELELTVISMIDSAVPAAHTETFVIDTTSDCLERNCKAQEIYKLILDLANRVLRASGVFPNYLLVGNEALVLFEGAEDFRVDYAEGDSVPVGIARNYVGVLNRRFNLIYDPFLDNKIILGFRDPNDEFATGVVYAPFIPFGMTPPMVEKDLTTYRVAFAVDAAKVVYPEMFAKVVLA